ncbi:MAG: YlxR family protein, partial [[Eubacterium] sulci]|nr:YlxR family protein [[Eubacterium] sulci]
AYVCKSIECFDNACKKRVFARVFRHKVDQENIDKLRGEFDGKIQV